MQKRTSYIMSYHILRPEDKHLQSNIVDVEIEQGLLDLHNSKFESENTISS